MTQREEELDKELNELKSKLLEYKQFLIEIKRDYMFNYSEGDSIGELMEEFERLFKLQK